MHLKNKKRGRKFLRSLSLILCLSLMCMPMTGMAYATELDEITEPALDVIPETTEVPPETLENLESLETEEPTEPPAETVEDPVTEETPELTESPEELPAETTEPDPTVEVTESEPTEEPEVPDEPTDTPEADYKLDVDFPSGWFAEPVTLVIRIEDVNGVGWQKVEAALTDDEDAERMDLTEQFEEYGVADYTVLDNSIVYFFITDPDGTEHIEELEVDFVDYDPPEIRAGIDGSLLKVEAFDECSGMAGIYVNDGLYTTLKDGTLQIRIDEAVDELFFYIQGEDMLGNLTDYVVLANPFYEEDEPKPEPEPDEDDDHGVHCSEDCDCRKPSPPSGNTGSSGNGGNSGNSNGGGNTGTTQKPATPPAKSESTNTPAPETEATPTKIEKGEPLSTNSSAVTRDLLYDKYTNKQFVTVETRNGEILYLVIDYDKPIDEDGEQYETYFLNLVDEADLMALVEDETTVPVCTCKDKCEAGSVNLSCEVCKNNLTECAGKEKVKEPEPTEEPEPEPEKKDSGSGGMLIVVLLLALGGGGALYWFKFRKNKPDTKGPVDLDDYDYGDEDDYEDYETEPDDAEDDAENL